MSGFWRRKSRIWPLPARHAAPGGQCTRWSRVWTTQRRSHGRKNRLPGRLVGRLVVPVRPTSSAKSAARPLHRDCGTKVTPPRTKTDTTRHRRTQTPAMRATRARGAAHRAHAAARSFKRTHVSPLRAQRPWARPQRARARPNLTYRGRGRSLSAQGGRPKMQGARGRRGAARQSVPPRAGETSGTALPLR